MDGKKRECGFARPDPEVLLEIEMAEGIHKQWKLARLKKELRRRLDHVDYGSSKTQDRELADYLAEQGQWIGASDRGWIPSIYLDSLGLLYQRQGAFAVLDGDEGGWERLALGTAYVLRSQSFYLARQDRIFKETARGHFGFESACRTLAQAYALGWNRDAREFGIWLIAGTLEGYYFDAESDFRNCVNWFYLRLFADFAGLQDIAWPANAVTVPEYQALLDRWRQPEGEALLPLLLAACDRHTHECFNRSANPSKRLDFEDDVVHGWPIEIHLLMRLRAELGLATPMPEHPLMQTGLGRLPEVRPMPTDALLDALTDKVCTIYPELRPKLAMRQ